MMSNFYCSAILNDVFLKKVISMDYELSCGMKDCCATMQGKTFFES